MKAPAPRPDGPGNAREGPKERKARPIREGPPAAFPLSAKGAPAAARGRPAAPRRIMPVKRKPAGQQERHTGGRGRQQGRTRGAEKVKNAKEIKDLSGIGEPVAGLKDLRSTEGLEQISFDRALEIIDDIAKNNALMGAEDETMCYYIGGMPEGLEGLSRDYRYYLDDIGARRNGPLFPCTLDKIIHFEDRETGKKGMLYLMTWNRPRKNGPGQDPKR